MPFIAIAAVIALFVGGGVTVAADQAKPGDALYSYKTTVNDNVRNEYHSIRASLNAESDTDVQADTSTDVKAQSAMKIRPDASSTDPDMTDPVLNADGSIKVNIF